MSLELVLREKTITKRKSILSSYLKNNIGFLNDSECSFFKHIFEQFYTPDEGESKFTVSEILKVSIIKDSRGNNCFRIHKHNDIQVPASIKRLSGNNRSKKANLIRALRNDIEPQIKSFRKSTPLNPESICPITKKKIGIDAEIDHVIPFHVLAEKWLENQQNEPCFVYNQDNYNYTLNQPYLSSWCDFHSKNCELRWLSREGNRLSRTYCGI